MKSKYLRLLVGFVWLLLRLLEKGVHGGGVFQVKYKYAGMQRTLSDLRAHDSMRHPQILAGVDLPLGGSGRPDASGLYYAKIGIGTPAKDYYVQVDTGSDIMWVNCINCRQCPTRGYRGMQLTQYNVKESVTGKMISCHHEFCREILPNSTLGCTPNVSCLYTEAYGDGSYSMGYFVQDIVQYDQVSGDLQTQSANGTVIFGCGAGPSADVVPPEEAFDGILGFGKSNSSMISQLASSGRVNKMFAHCLDGENGGGIFAIGNVVQPKVNMTPLVPNQPHYNVNMTAIRVGLSYLSLPSEVFTLGDKTGAIIDSGTTLAYLPDVIYQPLVRMILSWQPDVKLQAVGDGHACFDYSESVDDGFPPVTFYFGNSLYLRVYPHDYLFPNEDLMCIGWQNSEVLSGEKQNTTLLGDFVLSNKLVLYDLENETIGWTEYNCSSSIKLKDEITGSVHVVGAHSISSGHRLSVRVALLTLLVMALLQCLLHLMT